MTKKEAQYRTRLIQENHYTKDEQKILDAAVSELGGYREVYNAQRKGYVYTFMAAIALRRYGEWSQQVFPSIFNGLAEVFATIAQAMWEISLYFGGFRF